MKKRRFVEKLEINGQECEFLVNPDALPEDFIQALWELYSESLSIEESVQEQVCYTPESFRASLFDDDYHVVVMVIDGEPMGLIMGTNDVLRMRDAYVNPGFLISRLPREAEEGRIMYLTNLLLSPHLRHLGFVRPFIEVCVRALKEERYFLGFDVCDSRRFMADFLPEALKEAGYPVERELLGRQHYFLLKPVSVS